MGKHFFSVIIPTLNEEKFLPKLLASLTGQTLKNFEVIIVDGSSKDKTVETAKEFNRKLPSLSVIVSKKASLPLQRNLGARAARGTWLAFIDADGILMPYFFERATKFVSERHPSLFTTWFQPDSDKAGEAMFTLLGNMTVEGSILFHRPMAPGPLTLVLKSAYESVGGYDEEHAYHEDVDFGLRLAKKGITPDVLRETLCVWSLRRIRKEGAFKVVQQYIRSALPVLFLNKTMKYMPGYIMGGQLYGKDRKPIRRPVLKQFELKLKNLMKEFFG